MSAEIQIPKKPEKFWTSPTNKANLQQRGLSLSSSTPVFAKQDVLLNGSVTDERIVPAQFLVCNVNEAYVMMCDGKRRKCKKPGKQCTCCILSQTGRIVLRKQIRFLESLITYNSTYKYVVFLSL